MRPALWAGAVLLALPATTSANAIIFRPGDPGHDRARAAEDVAPLAVMAAFVAAAVWLTRSRARSLIAAWVTFVGLVLYFIGCDASFFTRVRFVPPTEPEPHPSFRLRPGELTDNEERVCIALGVVALAVGGIWLGRRSVAKGQSQPPPLDRR